MATTPQGSENPTGESTDNTDEFLADEFRFPAERKRGILRGAITDAAIRTENADRGYFELLPVERGLVEIVARADEGDHRISTTLSLSPAEARRFGRYLFELALEAEESGEIEA